MEKRILGFYANNFKDIFIKIFNEYNVENKFNIMDVEEDKDEKCFNHFKIFCYEKIIHLRIDWSIEREYKEEGKNEKEYTIRMVVKLSRNGVKLKKRYYFDTFTVPFKFEGGVNVFKLISQTIIDTSRMILSWDMFEKEEEI